MNTDQLLTHAQKLLALHGKPDASGYTGDRRIVWIGEQPRFTTDVCTIPAYQDAYIKAIATELNPLHEFILIAGGDSIIKPHRDATFAHPDAISINLGGDAYFESEDGDRLLSHGDISKFNCKRLHAVSKADSDRIVIVIWQRNPKWVEKNYKQGALF
jgi:hypothetical protein